MKSKIDGFEKDSRLFIETSRWGAKRRRVCDETVTMKRICPRSRSRDHLTPCGWIEDTDPTVSIVDCESKAFD
jgi:hypothetical protein